MALSVIAVAIAGSATAGNIYSWQTQSGDVAYTDDIKNVPARYRDQVEKRETASLGDYERFSAQDSAGVESYGAQLQARLNHLQQLNDSFRRTAEDTRGDLVGSGSLRIAGTNGQSLDLTGAASDEPVIVERVRVIRSGQIATRHDTVIRQGNRTLAIIRGNQEGEVSPYSNVVNEEDLERYR